LEVVGALQRRRAAGTLLAGACRPAEVEWLQCTYEHILQHDSDGRAAAVFIAPFVGYTAYLEAASVAATILLINNTGDFSATQQQLRACLPFIADAAELMMQPRIHEEYSLAREGRLVSSLRELIMRIEHGVIPRGADSARLLDSWQRLQRSGVLQRRDVDRAIQFNHERGDARLSAHVAAAAAPGLRSCGLASCGAREAHPAHFKSCSACRGVAYCCKEHQAEHWPAHKAACKAARKAAAAANDDAGPSDA
jgi:hypothetical protein